MILAISAILVANVSAQEVKHECKGKQFSKEERVELDIKRFTHDLMLSDKQAEKFAATYREYSSELNKLFEKNGAPEKCEPGKQLTDEEIDKKAKQRFENFKALADLQSKYWTKFRKDLSARQTEKVMKFNCPFGQKPECCGQKGGCDKKEGFGPKREGFGPRNEGWGRPENGKHGPRPAGPRSEDAKPEK